MEQKEIKQIEIKHTEMTDRLQRPKFSTILLVGSLFGVLSTLTWFLLSENASGIGVSLLVGTLVLFALNPLAPYRWRWRGQGLRVSEPVTWRRRLRAVGLVPEPVSQGIGPTWEVAHDPCLQDGAGLRAAFLLRAQKRRLPMTPGRGQRVLRLQAGSA